MIQKILIAFVLAFVLAGCAHRELLAPCDTSESPVPIGGGQSVKPTADCGPMRQVNP